MSNETEWMHQAKQENEKKISCGKFRVFPNGKKGKKSNVINLVEM